MGDQAPGDVPILDIEAQTPETLGRTTDLGETNAPKQNLLLDRCNDSPVDRSMVVSVVRSRVPP